MYQSPYDSTYPPRRQLDQQPRQPQPQSLPSPYSQQQQPPQQQLDRRLEYRGGYSYLAANESRRAENQRVAERERQEVEAYAAAHRPQAFAQSLGGGGDARTPDRRAFLERKEAEMRQRQMARYVRATAGHPVPAGFASAGRTLTNDNDGDFSNQQLQQQQPSQQQHQKQRMRQANAAFLDRISMDSDAKKGRPY